MRPGGISRRVVVFRISTKGVILARSQAVMRKDTVAKILITDDSAFARLNCKKALIRSGHDVLEASSAPKQWRSTKVSS